MNTSTADYIRAHAIGIDLLNTSKTPRERNLRVELNGAYDYITRLEFRLASANRRAERWRRKAIAAAGLFMLAVIVIEAMIAGRV